MIFIKSVVARISSNGASMQVKWLCHWNITIVFSIVYTLLKYL